MPSRLYEKQRKFAGCDSQKIVDHIKSQDRTVDKALKNVADRVYIPPQLKPLCESTVEKVPGKGKNDDTKTDPRFFVRIGTSKALNHSDFKKRFLNNKLRNTFISHLESFYNEKFKGNERPYIAKTLNKEGVIHILLTGRTIKRRKSDDKISSISDQIIGAVSFYLTNDSALILWLGVSSKKFDGIFGQSNIDKNHDFPTFGRNFHIGTFLLVCVQQYFFVRNGKYEVAAQVHEGSEDGPTLFYTRNYFHHVIESDDTIISLRENCKEFLLDDDNLIWMVCNGLIAELSCYWLTDLVRENESFIFLRLQTRLTNSFLMEFFRRSQTWTM